MSILEVNHIEKHFGATKVLNDISFSLEKGQALSIIGSSGSGKTTLLRCLNFLETPDGGTISVNNNVIFDAADPSTQQEKEIRSKRLHFGLVFQNFNLFPQYSALRNLTLAPELRLKNEHKGKDKKAALKQIREEAMSLLKTVGLEEKAANYPCQLSGGQQQRVAIGRAIITHPAVIFADEPTGNLDAESAQSVADMLDMASDMYDQTIIMVTHDKQMAERADRIITISDGRVDVH